MICRKVSKSIGILCKLSSILPVKSLKCLYFSLIQPYLSYCNLIWGNTFATHLNPLIILQKRAIRLVCKKSYYFHTDSLFKNSKILKLVDINKLNLACFMYKNHLDPIFTRNHPYGTRNQNSSLPAFQRLTMTQQSIYYSGPLLWNTIPPEIKHSSSLDSFKRKYKNHLLNLYESNRTDE